MPDAIVQTLAPGDTVRPGDVITVGGIPHIVADVREVARNRKRLLFADGNVYVLARTALIEVTRAFASPPSQPVRFRGTARGRR